MHTYLHTYVDTYIHTYIHAYADTRIGTYTLSIGLLIVITPDVAVIAFSLLRALLFLMGRRPLDRTVRIPFHDFLI